MDGEKEVYQEIAFKKTFGSCDHPRHVQWVNIEGEDDNSESIGEDSGDNSAASSSCSSELEEDASSSSTSPSYGPLYELSELMNQLPIKRGLSKHFQGKSQSFTSLANVKSLEDLAKKVSPYSQRMKSCKSYAGLAGHKFGPKAVIAKKTSLKGMGSSFFLSSLGSRGNFVGSCRNPISLQKNC
ncbi:hypothetical protein ACH5RR_004143 [Cinchona calisaya]|uniref:Oxidative stress 3 n=1 Tax=Cinchona calisaya TaxID=153742 RepID=A0ABD3AWU0_9GENT